jgi:HSP20 family molecular chaperone IbpA
MWSEACEMLALAERMHREFFLPARARREPVWEPPADVLETEAEVLVFVALPGVDSAEVEAAIDGADLLVAGRRVLPPALRTSVIHRLELPQGRFEKRVCLPAGRYSAVHKAMVNGCLLVTLEKGGMYRG